MHAFTRPIVRSCLVSCRSCWTPPTAAWSPAAPTAPSDSGRSASVLSAGDRTAMGGRHGSVNFCDELLRRNATRQGTTKTTPLLIGAELIYRGREEAMSGRHTERNGCCASRLRQTPEPPVRSAHGSAAVGPAAGMKNQRQKKMSRFVFLRRGERGGRGASR